MKAFILHLYVSRKKANAEPFYHHFTTAVDTRNIQVFHIFLKFIDTLSKKKKNFQYVFTSVKETILRRNLDRLMLQ